MELPREQWTPILNDAGEQVGWDTGAEEIKFSSPKAFLQAEGVIQLAIGINRVNREKPQGPKQDMKVVGRKRGKVAPKQPRGKRDRGR